MKNLLERSLIPLLVGAAVCFGYAADPPPVPQKAWRGKAAKSAARTETFMPMFTPTSITCGNKTVTWDPDGRIQISNANGVLLWMIPFFCYMTEQKKIKETKWHGMTG